LKCVAVCCRVLLCVAVCCSVLQCVAVYYSVLQCAAMCCNVLQCVAVTHLLKTIARNGRGNVIAQCTPGLAQQFAVACKDHSPFNCRLLQCVAVCCSALQCVAVRCSVLQCVAV